MQKNESMMIVATYFWSDTINAFMFGHGLATPTLMNVYMLTDLDISTADDGLVYSRKPEYKVNTRNITRLDRVYPRVQEDWVSWSEGTCHIPKHVVRKIYLLWSIGRANQCLPRYS